MKPDLKTIKEYYSKMDIDRLEKIVKSEIAKFEPEVRFIIEREMKKRGMNENLFAAIEAQTKVLSGEQILEATEKVKNLKCPNCGNPNNKLVGGNLTKVRGYIFFAGNTKQPVILCPDCLNKIQNKALFKNLLLGWWSFPSGFIRTPQAIFNHFTEKKEHRARGISEIIIKNFVIKNIGELKTNWKNEDELSSFILHKNDTH